MVAVPSADISYMGFICGLNQESYRFDNKTPKTAAFNPHGVVFTLHYIYTTAGTSLLLPAPLFAPL